jgi:hypothetical protein
MIQKIQACHPRRSKYRGATIVLVFIDVVSWCHALIILNHTAGLMNTGLRYPSNNFSYVYV